MQSNPNGANQYLLDPRQKMCWDFYVNPKSETFGNATQSAIRAGYEMTTADQITTSDWFIGKTRRLNLLDKAEKVLNETLEIPHIVDKIGMFGPVKDPDTKERVKEVDSQVLKIKQDTAKFLTERLGKNEGYSTRTELSGVDGKDLPTPIYGGQSNNPVQRHDSDKKDIQPEQTH